MGNDFASRVGWGVVLGGEAFDLDRWREALKRPFDPLDPWVMETKDGLILRSGPLDSAATKSEARERAEALMDRVNGAIRASYGAGAVRFEGITEILSDGTFRRHFFYQADPGEFRRRGGAAVLSLDGKPQPSEPQRWLSIAANDVPLADALTYFARGDDWFDVYKALECLELRFGGEVKFRGLGWASASKIKLLKKTANSQRHARLRFAPPPSPMERTEARGLLATLMARAFQEAPATPPPKRGRGGRKSPGA